VLNADARAEQRTQFTFSGALGRVVNIFGGRSAREGVKSTVLVKGDRKATLTGENTSQIIDLREEKIYDVDIRRKQYKVTTFDQLRKEMEEARKRAQEEARSDPEPQPEPSKDAREVEVDFDVKETGQKKPLNGFETRQVIMTIALREKGRTLEEGGGLVLTSDMWLAPRSEVMKEISDFDLRYAKQLYGEMLTGASAQEMAAALAANPLLKDALGRMREETVKLDGTAIMSTTTVDAVKSAAEMAAAKKADEPQPRSGVGGALGGLARRATRRDAAPQQRATFMTTTAEVLALGADVPADAVQVPAGFKETK
jgi:hypothetical protein